MIRPDDSAANDHNGLSTADKRALWRRPWASGLLVLVASCQLFTDIGDLTFQDAPPECGNGVPEAGEQCDDGNDDDLDACSNACVTATCQDGIQNQGESDTDCGSSCDGCAEGLRCTMDADCLSSNCYADECVAACEAWQVQDGTALADSGRAIALDAMGELYVTGFTQGALDGNPHAGAADVFLRKYDALGNKLYTRQIGSDTTDIGKAIAVAENGIVAIAGESVGAFDGHTPLGDKDAIIVVYDENTTKLWSAQVGTLEEDRFEAVAFASDGSVYAAGYTRGSYGPHVNMGSGDLLVIKFDTTGNEEWSLQMGGGGIDIAYAMAVDDQDNVIVAGYAVGSFDGQEAFGEDDVMVAKLAPDGSKLWSRQIGSDVDDEAEGVAVDAAGNIYVAGWTAGSFEGGMLAGDLDNFVLALDAQGNTIRSLQWGTSAFELANGIAVDAEGTLYVAGLTAGDLDGNFNAGSNDLFVTAIDAAGRFLWTHQAGTTAIDEAVGVAVGPSGQVYLTGGSAGGFAEPNLGSTDLIAAQVCAP